MKRRLLIDGDILAYKSATMAEVDTKWEDGLWTLHADENYAKSLLHSEIETLQENLEKYFKSKKIKFERRKKPTELEIDGFDGLLIFKPLKAKGTGGLKFEAQFESDINDWFKRDKPDDWRQRD